MLYRNLYGSLYLARWEVVELKASIKTMLGILPSDSDTYDALKETRAHLESLETWVDAAVDCFKKEYEEEIDNYK